MTKEYVPFHEAVLEGMHERVVKESLLNLILAMVFDLAKTIVRGLELPE
jgi:hypothetical protein